MVKWKSNYKALRNDMGQSTKASKRLTDLLACGVNKLFVGSDLLTEAGSKVCVELSRSTFIYVRSPRR